MLRFDQVEVAALITATGELDILAIALADQAISVGTD